MKRQLRRDSVLAVDRGHGLAHAHRALLLDDLAGQLQHITGDHLLAEPCFLDAAEQGQLALVFRQGQGTDGTYLGQGLNHQHAGHHRIAGEVALELGLVGRDALDALGPLARLHIDDLVHQQERIPVGNDLLNLAVVQLHCHLLFLPLAQGHGGVVAAEAERVGQGAADIRLAALVGNDIQVTGLVGDLIVDGSGHKAVVETQGRDDGFHRTGSAQHVTRHGLGGTDHQLVGVAAEDLADGHGLTGVVEGRGGTVGVDVVHILQLEVAIGHGFGHGAGAALAVGMGGQ